MQGTTMQEREALLKIIKQAEEENATHVGIGRDGVTFINNKEYALVGLTDVRAIDDLKKIVELLDLVEESQLDAKRFQALLASPFKLFGTAGLDRKDMTKPTDNQGYVYITCDMWTKHEAHNADGTDALIGFADQAILIQQNQEERS